MKQKVTPMKRTLQRRTGDESALDRRQKLGVAMAIPMVAGLIMMLGWLDIRPFIQQSEEIASEAGKARMETATRELQHQTGLVEACNGMREDNPETRQIELTTAGRECLMKTLQVISAPAAVVYGATIAGQWLEHHPQDQLLSESGQAAIDRAWRTLADIEGSGWPIAAQDRLIRSAERSVILRTLGIAKSGAGRFTSLANDLEHAEVALVNPNLHQKQDNRRLMAALGHFQNRTHWPTDKPNGSAIK